MDGLTLLAEARAAGLTVEADGDRLVLRGPKSAEELAQRLLRNKTEVMAALDNAPTVDGPESPAASEEVTAAVCESRLDTPATDSTLAPASFADWIRRPDATGRWGWERRGLPDWQLWWARSTFEELPEPPPPCSKCGSLELWETLAGAWRCLHCDGPTTAIRLLEQAAAIRRRHGKPDPPGAAGLAVELAEQRQINRRC